MVERDTTEEKVDYKMVTIALVVGLIVGLILIFTLGTYSWNQLKAASAEAKNKKEVLVDAEKRLATLKTLEDKADELKAKNLTVLAALPKDRDVSNLFTQLEKIGSESGVKINSVNEAATTNTSSGSQIVKTVSYTATGQASGYASLKNALSKFENSLRILSIPKFEVRGEASNNLDVNFDITTYTRGQE